MPSYFCGPILKVQVSTSVCYIWPARNISMSLAYIGMSGSDVAALV
jgi:hypothetical protein